MATQIDLGAVVPIGKGDWDINTTYERANIVRHNSVAWICKVESSTGVEPTEDSSDWYLLVKDTSSVTSVNGQRGDVNLDIISPSQVDNKIDTEINNVKSEINSKIPSVMVGASDEISGKSGIVPAPQAGEQDFFLRGDGTWAVSAGLPLGHFFTWPFSTPPDGSIIVNGSTYSRTLYADLWSYISSKSDWVKTESEWQSIASANNGYCPYYSDGDGSTTFRVPKFAPYQQIALSSASAGTYHEAGLPNATGFFSATVPGDHSHSAQGVFSGDHRPAGSLGPVKYRIGGDVDPKSPIYGYAFSLSKSSPIYGKSTTVQPESNEWIVCVVAFGKATNVGNVDVANVMSAVETVQSNLTNYLPLTGGNLTGELQFSSKWYMNYASDEGSNGFLIWSPPDTGAYCWLMNKDSHTYPGGFVLSARGVAGTDKQLVGLPTGSLAWNNQNIVRTVNGVGADAAGNVSVNVTTVANTGFGPGYHLAMNADRFNFNFYIRTPAWGTTWFVVGYAAVKAADYNWSQTFFTYAGPSVDVVNIAANGGVRDPNPHWTAQNICCFRVA